MASVRKVTRLETGNQSSCFLRSVIRTRRNERERERKRKREKERRGFSNERTGSVGRFVGLTFARLQNTGAKKKRKTTGDEKRDKIYRKLELERSFNRVKIDLVLCELCCIDSI